MNPFNRVLSIASTLILALFFFSIAAGRADQSSDFVQYLKTNAQSPTDYVLSKFKDRRIVVLGENHWIRHDVNLIIDLIPRLKTHGVSALAVETLQAGDQEKIDLLIASERWNPAAAAALLRTASWPYREYLEIIHAVWKVNRELPPQADRLKLIALSPGSDWRERLLPIGKTYDSFMAQIIIEHLKQPSRRILIYSGVHHAFTRYHQSELPRAVRVERFMDRMGNILWREFGEDVFMITLHRPWQSRAGDKWIKRLPAEGAIDCAASKLDRPVGFDVAGSPVAELRISPEFLYGMGYPSLRLGDITDGYIWTVPIEEYRGVELMPLSEFAPDEESLLYVSQHNPFSDQKGLGRAELESLWKEEGERLRDLPKSSGWQRLFDWRTQCKELH